MKHTILMVLVLPVFVGATLCNTARGDQPVIEWVQVETNEHAAQYLVKVEAVLVRMKEIRPKMRSRVFRAAYAGPDTGLVYVMNEFPDLEYFAGSQRDFERDPEYLKGLEELSKTGRVVKGEALLFDITPARNKN